MVPDWIIASYAYKEMFEEFSRRPGYTISSHAVIDLLGNFAAISTGDDLVMIREQIRFIQGFEELGVKSGWVLTQEGIVPAGVLNGPVL